MNETFWERASVWILAGILITAAVLMLKVSAGDSAIMDELAHIPAGYGYVHNLDYRLNPEHPPFLKTLAALPVLALNPNFPTDDPAWTTELNGQWNMGRAFLYGSGNNPDAIVRTARYFPIFLTILTALLVYALASRLFGKVWALWPTLLFALSPTILAHGHYVTTDIAATFGILLGTIAFLQYLISPSKKTIILAGLAFGVAELCKFSTVLLVPYFVVLAIIWAVKLSWEDELGGIKKLRPFLYFGLRKLAGLAAIMAIGYLIIVYPVYFLFTRNYPLEKQSAETAELLKSYANGPTAPGTSCKLTRCPAELTIWASKHEATRPLAEYALGVLMTIQRAAGGNSSYFLGDLTKTGSRAYFPLVFSIKETLPVMIALIVALILALSGIFRSLKNKSEPWKKKLLKFLQNRFVEFALLLFVFIYWGWSMKTPLNIGVRHLLPTIPLIYILLTGAWKKWFGGGKKVWKIILILVLCAWSVIEVFVAYPYFLSYFNELGGGVSGGYRYVTDSNYDWGQDLLRLRDFVASHPDIQKIGVDYFGGGSPEYYMPGKAVNWSSDKGNPADFGIDWLAVSVNTLEGAFSKLIPDQTRQPKDEYSWLGTIRPPEKVMGGLPPPDYRAGTSIFIYKLR